MQFDFKYISLRTRKMNYNVRSWPTKVQSAKFTEQLAYNEAEGGITPSMPQWSGRIAAQRWYHGNPTIKPLYRNCSRLAK